MVRERADNVNSAGGGTNDPGQVEFGNFAELYSRPGTVLAGDNGEQRAEDSVSHHGEQLAGELSQTWGPESRTADAVPQNLAIAADLPGLDILDHQLKTAEKPGDARAPQSAQMNESSQDAIASASRLAYNPDMATKLARAFDRIAQG